MDPPELIGREVEVVESTNPSLRSIGGRVVDESMKTLLVETARGIRRVPKAGCRFRFRWAGGRTVEIEGRDLVGRPEERVYIRPKA